MSKNRSAAGITNIVQYDANKNITFVSGSTTLLTVSSSGALTTTGTITAQTLVVQTITSSVNFVTGSTKFGAIVSNTHQFTGSLNVTGSLSVVTTGTEFQVTNTGVNLGNVLTDSHVISGSLRVNPNGLFVSSSGNVGIGTTTTSGRLDVQAPGTSAFSYYFRNSNGGYAGGVYNTGANHAQLYLATSAGTENVLVAATGSSFFNGGNVGIGTSNPSDILHVQKSSTGNVDTYFDNPNTTAGNGFRLIFRTTDSGGSTALNAGGIRTVFNSRGSNTVDNDIIVSTRGTDNIIVAKNNGNVGIGTTNATSRLTVSGDLNVQAGTLAAFGFGLQMNSTFAFSGTAYRTAIFAYNTGDGNGIQLGYDASAGTGIIAASTNGAGAGTAFWTFNGSSWGERMRITSGGTVQVRGEGQFGLDFNANNYIQISENQIRRIGNNTLFINNSNTGDVSININGGGTFVNGTNGYGRAVTNSSDERIKKNIVKIDNALDKVINMNGVYYEFNTENELGVNVPSGNKRIGLIAQQIESILPEAVFTPKEDNEPKSIDYSGMVGLLVNAIQELKAEIDALKAQ
jgi:hypothetical protein